MSSPDAGDDLDLHDLELIDHHCHAVVGGDLGPEAFEGLLGESRMAPPPGCSAFDTNLGLAVRAWCAPVLDLAPGSSGADYLARRQAIGATEVNARLFARGARQLLVDTGYRSEELVALPQLRRWAGGPVQEIVRLETVAEGVAATLHGHRGGGGDYADRFAAAMSGHADAVGWKTVAAYRGGLDLDWRRPGPGEVAAAAEEWLSGPGNRTAAQTGNRTAAAERPADRITADRITADRITAGGAIPAWRLTHPVLIRHGVWTALDTGRPVQFHTGFGDTDAPLRSSDPILLSELIADTAEAGTPIMLLHCWPHHRQAGYLTQMWPHVYLDIGEAIPHTGLRGPAVLAETLELAPWHKVLYSSDAFGLAELHHLGAVLHRRALARALRPLKELGFDHGELRRLATLVASGNARRVYPGLVPPTQP